jgi:hypothetical protein
MLEGNGARATRYVSCSKSVCNKSVRDKVEGLKAEWLCKASAETTTLQPGCLMGLVFNLVCLLLAFSYNLIWATGNIFRTDTSISYNMVDYS